MGISSREAESALVEKAQRGDQNSYGELVSLHYPGVLQLVYRMCGDMDLAQDAAQEAFIKAWLHLRNFEPGTSLRSWLYRIAINAALDVLRAGRKTAGADLESLSLTDPQAGPETVLVQKERHRLVQQAVLSLGESSRSILVLREYGGLSYLEIAAALDIPLGTVMSRLSYARTQLKRALLPYIKDGD